MRVKVIFPDLDKRVKNVAQTYSLEHKGERNLFDNQFALLNSSICNDESFPKELASCTGALHVSVSQYMAKEEQIFLLLIKDPDWDIWIKIWLELLEKSPREFTPCHIWVVPFPAKPPIESTISQSFRSP